MRLDEFLRNPSHDQMQRFVASERNKQAFELIAPEARTAVQTEIIPQLEEMSTGAEVFEALVEDAQQQVIEGFKTKDPTYTRLIRYKSIDQSDEQFAQDLVSVLREWAQSFQQTFPVAVTPPSPTPVQAPEDNAILLKEILEPETIVVDNPDPFSLDDMRL